MASQPSNRSALRRQRRRQRRRRVAVGVAVALLIGAGVVGAVVALSGDDDEPSATAGPRTTTATEPGTEPGEPAAEPGEPGADATPTTGPPRGPCEAGHLSAAVVTTRPRPPSSIRVVALTNTTRRSCTVSGYPALQLEGPNREPLATVVNQGGGAVPPELAVAEVTIDPGAAASFVMSWDSRAGTCLDVRTIGVTLPGDTKAITLEASVTVCGDGAVFVSPVQPGTVGI